ncbi:MAG: hypothetical protein FK730_01955 [Asgard group archaeon]|nr:hypothetical protein [Asgard group archaeon]
MVQGEIQTYKAFVQNHCVRDTNHMKNCLLGEFQKEIITLSLKLVNLRKLIVTEGRFTDFHTDLFEKLSKLIEQEAETLLLQTSIGQTALGQFGPIFKKQITFCSFCFKLGLEEMDEKIACEQATITYASILNYYLAGKLLDINRIKKLKEKLNNKKTAEQKDDFFDQVIDWDFSDISGLNPNKFNLIKEYLENKDVKEIVSQLNSEPKVIGNTNDNGKYEEIILDRLPLILKVEKLTEKDYQYLKQYELICDSCSKSYAECSDILNNLRIVLNNSDHIKATWEKQENLRPCISKIVLEKKK